MNKKIFLAAFAFGSIAMAMTSCDPIEDRDTLSNAFDADAIEVSASQDVDGGNKITLKMNTPGVQGYWDYLLGNQFSDEVTFVCPFTGELEFTFHTTTPYIVNGKYTTENLPTKSIKVNVTKLNNSLDAEYYVAAGDDLAGKKWVFDKASGQYWYMANSDGKEKWNDCWWNACGDWSPDPDAAMQFDLDGGLMVRHYTNAADATPNAVAKFAFSDKSGGKFNKITIPSSAMLGVDGQGNSADDVYEIVTWEKDKIVLYTNNTISRGTGWAWVLVPYKP